MTHTITQKVYLEDTDAGGVMYHASHIRFMERARTELIGTFGTSLAELHRQGLTFIVTHIDINYRAPAFLGDVLTISAGTAEARRVSMKIRQRMLRGETLIAEATVTIAMMQDGKLVRMPEELLSRLD